MWPRVVGMMLALSASACGDDEPPPMDSSMADTAPMDTGAPDATPPPPMVQRVAEPMALPLPAVWWRTGVEPGEDDPLPPLLIRGDVRVPTMEGVDATGLDWFSRAPVGENDLGRVPAGTGYWATTLAVPAGSRAFARAGGLTLLATPGAMSPGDPYAAGWTRVPIVTAGGDTPLVVQLRPGRRDAVLELFTTPDEVFFNFRDSTSPQLRVGQMEEQWLGVALLNLEEAPIENAIARVVESEHFEETEVVHRALPGGAVTQVAFRLVPKASWEMPPPPADPMEEPDWSIPVVVQLEAPSLDAIYEAETTVDRIGPEDTFRRTFQSEIDRSVQFYGVRPPSDFDPMRDYALVLSLHGASVNARNQANAYAPKDWAYVVAPTNRRPFGFDWEAWGRLDGLEVLAHAKSSFRIDETQVYLTGHSMGGHGTWQLGTLFPGRFALVGPSAGWRSFYTYGGASRPSGPFARAAASSDTEAYAENLTNRAVWIIHGDADDNVPVTEARAMRDLLTPFVPDLNYHEQPGAGHWWDDSPDVPGTDCVDWAPMFMRMTEVRLDPTELEFTFRSPSASVSPTHSFVTLRTALGTDDDLVVTSTSPVADRVELTTSNVRGLELDGTALAAKGITTVVVDGEMRTVTAEPMSFGATDGKHPEQHGPFTQAFAKPFCFIYPDGAQPYRAFAGYLATTWSIIGNGHACALPATSVDTALRDDWNLIWIGVASDGTGVADLPFTWDDTEIRVGADTHRGAGLAMVYPAGEGLDAFIFAGAGDEELLFTIVPFSSRFAIPDYLVWDEGGGRAADFFPPDWGL